jgi:hypothetical protein
MKRARRSPKARAPVPEFQETAPAVVLAPVRGCRWMGATRDDGSCARCGLPQGVGGCKHGDQSVKWLS